MNKIITLFFVLLLSSFAFSGEIPGTYPGNVNDTVISGAVTVNSRIAIHYITLPSGETTITLTNPNNRVCRLYLKQPSSGSAGTVKFSPTPEYSGGTAPTLAATNSAKDLLIITYDPVGGKYIIGSMLDVK